MSVFVLHTLSDFSKVMMLSNSLLFKQPIVAIIVLVALILSSLVLPVSYSKNSCTSLEDNISFADLNIPIYEFSNSLNNPTAIVVAFHGGCLYGGTYKTLAEQLAQRNCLLISFDMRGYGQWHYNNYGTKKDRTFNYDKTCTDIYSLIKKIRATYPNVPVYSLGESLGANMAMFVAGKNPEQIDGIIIVSPYSSPRIFFYPPLILHFMQICIAPWSKLNLNYYLERRLSHNRQWSLEQIADPMCRNRQSAFELCRSYRLNVKGKRLASKIPADMPVLFIVGEKDGLTRVKSSAKLYDQIPSLYKSYNMLPKHGHLVVETPYVKSEVVDIIGDWLEESNPEIATKLSARSRLTSKK
jgi:alpha-beta hydrolase superfamily lysophospholipase